MILYVTDQRVATPQINDDHIAAVVAFLDWQEIPYELKSDTAMVCKYTNGRLIPVLAHEHTFSFDESGG